MYRPVEELEFHAWEYLKGVGADKITVTVPVGSDVYATEEEARRVASDPLTTWTTDWDEREGILFLGLLPDDMAQQDSAWPCSPLVLHSIQDSGQTEFVFAAAGSNLGDYALHAQNPAWLLAKERQGANQTAAGGSVFLIGSAGEYNSSLEMSLSALRTMVIASVADRAENEYIGSVQGMVTYDGSEAISEEAVLRVKMIEMPSYLGDGLASVEYPLKEGARFPFTFSIRYNTYRVLREPDTCKPITWFRVEILGHDGSILYVNDPSASISRGKSVENIQVPVFRAPAITGMIAVDGDGKAIPEDAVLSLMVYQEDKIGDYPQYCRYSTQSHQLRDEARFPVSFTIPYNPLLINEYTTYVLHVDILGPTDNILYTSYTHPPVITAGVPVDDVHVIVGSPETINGLVTYDGLQAIPDGSVLSVRMRAPGYYGYRPSRSYSLAEDARFPIPFAIAYNPRNVFRDDYYHTDGDAYSIYVAIHGPDGGRLFEHNYVEGTFPLPLPEKTPLKARKTPVVFRAPLSELNGILTFAGEPEIPENTNFWVKLLEERQPNAYYTHDWICRASDPKGFPILFSINYPSADIDADATYTINAEVRGPSCLLYASDSVGGVITGGVPTEGVQVEVAIVNLPPTGEIRTLTGTVLSDTVEEDIRNHYLRNGDGSIEPGFITLYDVERGCTLGRQEIDGRTKFPLPFSFAIPYDAGAIDPGRVYELHVYIPLWHVACDGLCGSWANYSSRDLADGDGEANGQRVLTGGYPDTDVEVQVYVVGGIS